MFPGLRVINLPFNEQTNNIQTCSYWEVFKGHVQSQV